MKNTGKNKRLNFNLVLNVICKKLCNLEYKKTLYPYLTAESLVTFIKNNIEGDTDNALNVILGGLNDFHWKDLGIKKIVCS